MSAAQVHAYLFFGGNCEEAIEFYKQSLGAKVGMMMRFSESPDPVPEGELAPGFENKIMHADFTVGETMVMASDGCNEGDGKHSGFSLALTLPTAAEVDRAFGALSAGGQVTMPPCKTFWSEKFGMCVDKFGVSWMLMVAEAR
jgi:PhnB protein